MIKISGSDLLDESPRGPFPEYQGLARLLLEQCHQRGARLLAISGAQGTGKSTLVRLMGDAASALGTSLSSLSLDDFYRPAAERVRLARQVHALLRTRGVPGTHSVDLLMSTLDLLMAGKLVEAPLFDKGLDDRSGTRRVAGGSLLVLEGWCLGIPAVEPSQLEEPLNTLEQEEDPDGRWRQHVNTALGCDYRELHDRFDCLVFLRAPDFESSVRWRREQEQALPASQRMSEPQLQRFMAHYERLSRRALQVLPDQAAVIVNLNHAHGVESVWLRD